MSTVFSLLGNSNGTMRPLNDGTVYPKGTIINKMMGAGYDYKKFVIVDEEVGDMGQPCLALDLSMHSEAASSRDRAKGGVGIGSFDVTSEVMNDDDLQELRLQYAHKRQNEHKERHAMEEEKNRLTEIGKAIFEAAKPAGAEAVIIARLMKDNSDPMSDYHASSAEQTVILAWSFNKRENFDEMRKAGQTFEPTKEFCEGFNLKKYEHRDNYTGGNGYWIGSYRHSGWQLKKVPFSEYSLPGLYRKAANPETFRPYNSKGAAGSTPSSSKAGVTVSRNEEKNGIEIRFASKPDAATIEKLKSARFRWSKFSKCWYIKYSPGNWQFAQSFVEGESTATDPAAGMIQAQEDSLFEAFEREL